MDARILLILAGMELELIRERTNRLLEEKRKRGLKGGRPKHPFLSDSKKFALMLFDGQSWAMAPKHGTGRANNHVSSSTTRPGVYALVQQ